MGTLLATRLKLRRKELKLSQREVAEGICKQGQISRLENGEYMPGSEVLHALAKKLKVSMDYFFDEEVKEQLEELVEFRKLAKTFIYQRDYRSLNYIYQLEKANAHRLSLTDKIYMEWVGSFLDFHYFDKKEEAIKRLEKQLDLVEDTDLNALNLSNSLFNFYYDIGQTERFKPLEDRLSKLLETLSIKTLEELELVVKFNYNVCRHLWLEKRTEEAIQRVTKTIKLCQEHHSNYNLAGLYLLLGNITEGFYEKSKVKEYFEKSIFLYGLEDNQDMALRVKAYLEEHYSD